jgi:hypothetical protein
MSARLKTGTVTGRSAAPAGERIGCIVVAGAPAAIVD